MEFFDAHNHLQDERLAECLEEVVRAAGEAGVTAMVVNGSCESDWPQVQTLAQRFPMVIPSFGYHPWYVREHTPSWRERLIRFLDTTPGAVLGEIGLDRWIPDPDFPMQEKLFTQQMELATERNLPVSLHCLKAWGKMEEHLRRGPRPARGFLLHSYGGPAEMVLPLARLGAYFSFPGYFLLDRKERQREAFRRVPSDRLLVETDAPDQPLPENLVTHPLPPSADGRPINHPANLGAVYRGLATALNRPVESLAAEVASNFQRFFRG